MFSQVYYFPYIVDTVVYFSMECLSSFFRSSRIRFNSESLCVLL